MLKCGERSLLICLPFLILIFFALRSLVTKERNSDKDKFRDYNSPFFFSLISMSLYLLGGILELISRRRQKHKKKKPKKIILVQSIEKLLIPKCKLKPKEYLSTLRYYLTLLSATFCVCCIFPFTILITAYSKDPNSYAYMRISIIFFDLILTKFVLKTPIYRHQFLSICFIILGLIMVSSFLFIEKWDASLLCFFNYIVYAGFDVQVKTISNSRRYSIFTIMYLMGLFGSCAYLIILSFIWAIPCSGPGFLPCNTEGSIENVAFSMKTYFGEDALNKTLLLVAFVIVHIGYTICLLLTIYYFSPLHRCVGETLGVFILWMIQLMRGLQSFSVIPFLGYILIVISTLIYNEIIILDFCSLGEYTKQEINKRHRIETKMAEMEKFELTIGEIEIEHI